jgi:hypothetical protein
MGKGNRLTRCRFIIRVDELSVTGAPERGALRNWKLHANVCLVYLMVLPPSVQYTNRMLVLPADRSPIT